MGFARRERLVLVVKPSLKQELLRQGSSWGQVKYKFAARGRKESEVAAIDQQGEAYDQARDRILGSAPRWLPSVVVERGELPSFLFRETDLVAVLGPSGLFVNVAKYVDDQPVLTFNSESSPQVFMQFDPSQAGWAVDAVALGSFRPQPVSLAEATSNQGETLLAVNDFLVGRRDHVSARYTLSFRNESERQVSSGVVVSTGAGSTGWLRSICSGAKALMQEFNENVDVSACAPPRLPLESRELIFAVREPFKLHGDVLLPCGRIEEGESLVLDSDMAEGGVVFSDGVAEDAIDFSAGAQVEIRLAERQVQLVGAIG